MVLVLLAGSALAAGCVSESAVHADRQAAEPVEAPPEGVVAVVNGVEVSSSELEEAIRAQLLPIQTQRHEAMEQGLQRLISERLLEAEAGARGVSVDELRKTEVEEKVAAVTDGEVDVFYEARKDQIPQPKEQVAGQIREYLLAQRLQQRQEVYLAELREKFGVRIYLEPFRLAVDPGDSPARGPVDAPVTIVEFSDFECPYCSRVVPSLERVKTEYGDRVRLVFRQFPLLAIHPNAQKAAEASLCAHDQGKFWEMHDTLFKEQRALGIEQLKQKAARLELDTDRFNKCLDTDQFADKVAQDLEAGAAVGVQGTPAIFINGRPLNGAQPFEVISKVIEEELAAGGS